MCCVCLCPVSIRLVVLPPLKSSIARMPVSLRHTAVIIVVEVIGVVALGSRGWEHQLDIVTMVLHDAVVIPSNVASVTNPLLQSREIISGIEVGHSLNFFHFCFIYIGCTDISYIRKSVLFSSGVMTVRMKGRFTSISMRIKNNSTRTTNVSRESLAR